MVFWSACAPWHPSCSVNQRIAWLSNRLCSFFVPRSFACKCCIHFRIQWRLKTTELRISINKGVDVHVICLTVPFKTAHKCIQFSGGGGFSEPSAFLASSTNSVPHLVGKLLGSLQWWDGDCYMAKCFYSGGLGKSSPLVPDSLCCHLPCLGRNTREWNSRHTVYSDTNSSNKESEQFLMPSYYSTTIKWCQSPHL